jgi:hypothetical protein
MINDRRDQLINVRFKGPDFWLKGRLLTATDMPICLTNLSIFLFFYTLQTEESIQLSLELWVIFVGYSSDWKS